MRLSVPVLMASLAFAAAPARADDLANAQRAYADLDYSRCAEEASRALTKFAPRAARLESYRLLGICEAAQNNAERAREAFKRMLAVDKDARLPEGLSPRFKSAFREAKGSFVSGAPLVLSVEEESVQGGTRTVRLRVTDELSLVHKISWRGAGGLAGAPVRVAPKLELELPATADVTVFGLDQTGGEVTELLLPGKKPAARPPPPPPPPEDEGVPWGLVGGVAGGAVVLGALAVGAVLIFAPPQAVTLKTDVVFGE